MKSRCEKNEKSTQTDEDDKNQPLNYTEIMDELEKEIGESKNLKTTMIVENIFYIVFFLLSECMIIWYFSNVPATVAFVLLVFLFVLIICCNLVEWQKSKKKIRSIYEKLEMLLSEKSKLIEEDADKISILQKRLFALIEIDKRSTTVVPISLMFYILVLLASSITLYFRHSQLNAYPSLAFIWSMPFAGSLLLVQEHMSILLEVYRNRKWLEKNTQLLCLP